MTTKQFVGGVMFFGPLAALMAWMVYITNGEIVLCWLISFGAIGIMLLGAKWMGTK